MRQDPAVTVGLPLAAPQDSPLYGAEALIWTTTPWTTAVQPRRRRAPRHRLFGGPVNSGDLAGRSFVLAEARRAVYAAEFGEDAEVVTTLKGTERWG